VTVRVLVASLLLGIVAFTAVRIWGGSPAPNSGSKAAFSVTGIVTDNLAAFDQRCGCRPDVAVHYVRWGESPTVTRTLADLIIAHGAVPMLELEPFGVPLTRIVDGRGDAYLLRFAKAVKSLHAHVLMSFEPESNGNWYSWGYPHVRPATEVAAWRHVVKMFDRAGARNVTWVWIINTAYNGSGPIAALWPGNGYVSEAGIDGYFKSSHDTFSTVFGPTVAALRRITGKPVLISETSASTVAGQSRALGELATGVIQYRLTGFIWFDINQTGQRGLGKADWSIDDEPSLLATFRKMTNIYW
jgi:mannan endo-1,4-beta-mannosidase